MCTNILNFICTYYQKWIENEKGVKEKGSIKQTKGENWAIRKPLHKESIFGAVNLKFKKIVSLSIAIDNYEILVDKLLKRRIKELIDENYDKKAILKYFKDANYQWNEMDVSKVEIFYFDNEMVAKREAVNDSFTSTKIETITDTGIQKILLKHLENYNEFIEEKIVEHPELAFSPEGIEELNKNIEFLNSGKSHQPIFKVRTYEPKGKKFVVGIHGNKKDKYVEAATGTNLFFGIYQDENGKRNYDSIPLNIVIERLKQKLVPVPEANEKGHKLLFYLSPNDLVFVPNSDEIDNMKVIDFTNLSGDQKKRIYKMVSSTSNQCFFIRHDIATSIVDKMEFSPLNKMEKSMDGVMIKDVCIKLKTDRLGNISKA